MKTGNNNRRLNRLCDKYNLSQGEVLKILLDLHDRAERLGMIHFQPAVLTMAALPGEPEPAQPKPRQRSRQGGHASKPYQNKRNAELRARTSNVNAGATDPDAARSPASVSEGPHDA